MLVKHATGKILGQPGSPDEDPEPDKKVKDDDGSKPEPETPKSATDDQPPPR